MDSEELVTQLHTLLSVDVPKGTLRRWAWEGLIDAPVSKGRKGKRGRFVAWSSKAVEQASAVYQIRHNDKRRWAKTTKEVIRATRVVVDHFYATLQEFEDFEDPNVLRKLDDFLKPVKSPLFAPDGMTVYMHGGLELQPLVATWIATVEKIRHSKPVSQPMGVCFNWNRHVCDDDGTETFKVRYDGVTFTLAPYDAIGQHYGHTPAALKKRLGREPTDWGEEKRQGNVITFDKNTDWDNVQFDVENQQIIITDRLKRVKVVDLKNSGIRITED